MTEHSFKPGDAVEVGCEPVVKAARGIYLGLTPDKFSMVFNLSTERIELWYPPDVHPTFQTTEEVVYLKEKLRIADAQYDHLEAQLESDREAAKLVCEAHDEARVALERTIQERNASLDKRGLTLSMLRDDVVRLEAMHTERVKERDEAQALAKQLQTEVEYRQAHYDQDTKIMQELNAALQVAAGSLEASKEENDVGRKHRNALRSKIDELEKEKHRLEEIIDIERKKHKKDIAHWHHVFGALVQPNATGPETYELMNGLIYRWHQLALDGHIQHEGCEPTPSAPNYFRLTLKNPTKDDVIEVLIQRPGMLTPAAKAEKLHKIIDEALAIYDDLTSNFTWVALHKVVAKLREAQS